MGKMTALTLVFCAFFLGVQIKTTNAETCAPQKQDGKISIGKVALFVQPFNAAEGTDFHPPEFTFVNGLKNATLNPASKYIEVTHVTDKAVTFGMLDDFKNFTSQNLNNPFLNVELTYFCKDDEKTQHFIDLEAFVFYSPKPEPPKACNSAFWLYGFWIVLILLVIGAIGAGVMLYK